MTSSFVFCRYSIPLVFALTLSGISCRRSPESPVSTELEKQGREIFRYDTFGDERFWTDTAQLHKTLEKIRPLQALGLGVKVDLAHLNLAKFLIHNPFGTSGTRELLRQNAVVGVQATFDKSGHIAKAGITCAFCHSTVDNALLPGIGYRIDGGANRDLKVGKILAMLPVFTPAQKAVLNKWPKGSYDPRMNVDGKSTPLMLPPAYGLAGVKNETYTAEGPISYWNAYVAVTQMHGQGSFSDPRLGINIVNNPDLVTPKLAALRAYQHSIRAPVPSSSEYNASAAAKGRQVFGANCASCHVNGNSTDNNQGVLHAPAETGMDPTYAERTSQKKYRTTPLRALKKHAPYFHDGSATTLEDVVNHYARVRNLQLSGEEKKQLVEYLKSL
jgi:mono/diheme cytochrome c family protein